MQRAGPALPHNAHKGQAGRVALLVGSRWMRGAATLACRAAARGGAGLVVNLARDDETASQVFLTVPECVVLDCSERVDYNVAGALAQRAPHALVAGCGLSADACTQRMVEASLSFDGPLVLDADALNVLAGRIECLRERRAPTVLTPHPLEAERLLGAPVGASEAARLAAAQELARRTGALVVLKGAGTLVVEGTRTWRCQHGTPAMAKAGIGDVLAGLLGACLARTVSHPVAGWDAYAAACSAVERHALAGELAERDLSPNGVLASDLTERLPAAERHP